MNPNLLDPTNQKRFQNYQSVVFQRPPRYKMLLDDIMKQTPEDHVDRKDLAAVHQIYIEANKEINQRIGDRKVTKMCKQ